MKKLLSLLALLPAIALGQVAGVDNVTLSSVSSGDEVTRWLDNSTPSEVPYSENYVYADTAGAWDADSIPDGFDGIWLVHTNTTDASTVDASLVSFTTSGRAQVCVLWPTGITDPGWLASGSYLNSGRSVTTAGQTYDMYCAMKDGGALTFGDSGSVMYMVTVAPAWRAQPPVNTPSPDNNGFYVFATDTYELTEDTTTGGGETDPKLRRIEGTDGAVSVDVDDATGTTCTGFSFAKYPTTPSAATPVTFSWADLEGGNQWLNITTADGASDCIIIFEFENATGGISAGSDRQTTTITVRDTTTPPPSAGDLFVEIGGSGSDANDCTSGTPCATIKRASDLAVAGDTIEVQCATPGSCTYTSCTNLTNSGSLAGGVIKLQVRSGDTVNFIPSSCGTSDGAIIEFASGTDYWHIDGSVGTMVFGQTSDFNPENNASTFSHKMVFSGIGDNNYIEIGHVTAHGGNMDEAKCNRFRGGLSSHLYVHDSTFSRCGTIWDATNPTSDKDTGDLWNVVIDKAIFENNNFSLAGHDLLSWPGNYGVIRNNTFDADWTAYAGVDTIPATADGSRCFQWDPGNNLRGGTSPYGHAVIEGNTCINAGRNDTSDAVAVGVADKINGNRAIVRQNFYCEPAGSGTVSVHNMATNNAFTDAAGGQIESNRFYHNTYMNMPFWNRVIVDQDITAPNLTDMQYVNNLGDGFSGSSSNPSLDYDQISENVLNFRNVGWKMSKQGCGDAYLCDVYRNNWIHSDTPEYTFRARLPAVNAEWPAGLVSSFPANFTMVREVALDGTFDDTGGWTSLGDWTISGGVATKGTGIDNGISQNAVPFIPGEDYTVTFDISGSTTGGVIVNLGGDLSATQSGNGSKSVSGLVPISGSLLAMNATGSFDGSIDNVSAKLTSDPWPNATTRGTFSGYTDETDCNETGLALTGNGVGAGAPLAYVATTTTGTTIAVGNADDNSQGDAWFFADLGNASTFDLSYFGEAGDYVEFNNAAGTNSRIRRIASIDSQYQFTVTTSVTVNQGDEIRFVESDGSTVVDNMGAAQ